MSSFVVYRHLVRVQPVRELGRHQEVRFAAATCLDAQVCALVAIGRTKVPARALWISDFAAEEPRGQRRHHTSPLDAAKLPRQTLSAVNYQKQQLERHFGTQADKSYHLQKSSRWIVESAHPSMIKSTKSNFPQLPRTLMRKSSEASRIRQRWREIQFQY